MLAVVLPMAPSLAHSTPHSIGFTGSYMDAISSFTPVAIVTYSGHKPTRANSRDDAVTLSWTSHPSCMY